MRASSDRYRRGAGLSLAGVGVASVLGIVTAEALYPGYSTSRQTISALGAAGASTGPVEPSATVFNAAMIVSGLLALVAAAGLRGAGGPRTLVAVVAVTGLGVAGVGVFPAQHGAVHALAAFVTFGGGGLSAVLVATVATGPFRYVSLVLGVVALVALGAFLGLGGSTPLGIGGLERWVSYPIQLWTLAFGGYLLGGGEVAA